MKEELYRQGDVGIFPVNSIPEDLEEIKPDKGRVILAYGEVTGHAHALDMNKVKQYKSGDKVYLHVLEDAYVRHEEHDPFIIQAGYYEKRINREYVNENMTRKVID